MSGCPINIDHIRDGFTAAAILLALAAAGVSFIASLHPAPQAQGPAFLAPADPKEPFWKELKKRGATVARGARLNRWAVLIGLLSALAMFLWLFAEKCG